MIDVQLLRILKYRRDYKSLIGSIPTTATEPQTKAILDDFEDYFSSFPDHNVIDFTVFIPRFKRRHPTLTPEQWTMYLAILRNIQQDADVGTRAGILAEMHELALGARVAKIAADFVEGELETDLLSEVTLALDRFKLDSGIKSVDFIKDDIADLLKDEINDEGLRWRLSCLNNSMRGLRGGDFGIIAGRPDKGKTTFIADQITYMAPQLPEARNVLWLNNEGKGSRIIPRLYQAALGVKISEMILQSNANKLVPAYRAAIGGRLDKVRIFDIHGMHVGQIELILENNNPGIVVYDMIDHIRGFGDMPRTDLILEEMYKWARERSVKYDCVGLATSQISNEGDGLQFPTLGMLKDSKTGKQGACDFQLMIGASNDPNLQFSRFIGLPKNKLRREGAPGDPKAEVHFKGEIARYEEILTAA
jgi:replicative DNA helicase